METQKSKISQALIWFMPTWIELSLYIFISVVTLAISDLNFVKDFLFVSGDFNPFSLAINSISDLLTKVIGEKVAGSLSLAIFWGIIGLFINVVWWIFSNFSTELNNDLVFSGYMHPRGADPHSPLREFASKAAIRLSTTVVIIFYANYFFRQALPLIITRYRESINMWDMEHHYVSIISTLLFQILLLHVFVVLMRLLFLRKQIFSS